MENKSHAFAAGAFVLMVSALLVALAAWLMRDTVEHRVFELSSRDAVNGLQPQAAVRFRGVIVGKVTAIGFDPLNAGNVLVRLSIDDQAPITRSTYATLGFQGVTGLAFVQLDDAGESQEALPTRDDQVARIPLRQSLLSKLTDQGGAILTQLEDTSRRLNLLLAPDNQKQLMGAVQSLGAAASGVQQLSTTLGTLLHAQLGSQRTNLPQFVQEATATSKALQAAAARAGESADEVKKSAASLLSLTGRLNQDGGVIDQLGEGAAALAAAGQTVNSTTLPRLNRTADETARTVRQVSRAMDAVTDNPQALIFGNAPVPSGPGEPGFVAPSKAGRP